LDDRPTDNGLSNDGLLVKDGLVERGANDGLPVGESLGERGAKAGLDKCGGFGERAAKDGFSERGSRSDRGAFKNFGALDSVLEDFTDKGIRRGLTATFGGRSCISGVGGLATLVPDAAVFNLATSSKVRLR